CGGAQTYGQPNRSEIISTSPDACSADATSLNAIVPWRSYAAILYSPRHSPASAAHSAGLASSRTGRIDSVHPETAAAVPAAAVKTRTMRLIRELLDRTEGKRRARPA